MEGAVGFEAFWAFSLDRYARDGVATLCLALQDDCGADVNIVLACLFAAQQGTAIGEAELHAMMAGEAGDWQRAVVAPLRAARRAMKEPPPALDAGTVEAARRRLKAVEMEGERLEQMLLFEAFAGIVGDCVADVQARRGMGRAALSAYLDMIGVRAGPQVEALLRICID